MSKILVIAEHDGTTLNPSTAKTVACAADVDGAVIDIAVLASSASAIAAEAAQLESVARVLTIERSEYDHAITAIPASSAAMRRL